MEASLAHEAFFVLDTLHYSAYNDLRRIKNKPYEHLVLECEVCKEKLVRR